VAREHVEDQHGAVHDWNRNDLFQVLALARADVVEHQQHLRVERLASSAISRALPDPTSVAASTASRFCTTRSTIEAPAASASASNSKSSGSSGRLASSVSTATTTARVPGFATTRAVRDGRSATGALPCSAFPVAPGSKRFDDVDATFAHGAQAPPRFPAERGLQVDGRVAHDDVGCARRSDSAPYSPTLGANRPRHFARRPARSAWRCRSRNPPSKSDRSRTRRTPRAFVERSRTRLQLGGLRP